MYTKGVWRAVGIAIAALVISSRTSLRGGQDGSGKKIRGLTGTTAHEHSWETSQPILYEEKKELEREYPSREKKGVESYEDYLDQKAGDNDTLIMPEPRKKNSVKSRKGASVPEKHYSKKKPAVKKTDPPIEGRFVSYRVKKGDTLYGIAKKFNTTITSLAGANGLEEKSRVDKGRILKIPGARGSGNVSPKGDDKTKPALKEGAPRFLWPVSFVREYRRDGINGVRSIGLIISGKPGAPVVSSSEGVVKKIGQMRGFGRYIIIEHSDRYMTVYSNLKDIKVTAGMRISAGREIGRIDAADSSFHFQIDHAGKPLNPLIYLPKKG